jgi:tRNA(fMet)-specific endonuclease VapC
MYILDTNHCVFLINGLSKVAKGLTPQSQNTVKVYLALKEPLNVSAITISELYYGAYNSDPSKVADNLSRLEYFKFMLNVLPLTDAISKGYGEKRVELSRIGKGLTDFDLLIAYTAIVHNATLATNDKAFDRLVPLLKLHDWSTGSVTP